MEFEIIDGQRHSVRVTCPDCGDTRTVDEAHDFHDDETEPFDAEQHRAVKTCDACEYAFYEYEAHDWQYGEWESVGNSMFVRTCVCVVCGLDRSEMETFEESENITQSEETPLPTEQIAETETIPGLSGLNLFDGGISVGLSGNSYKRDVPSESDETGSNPIQESSDTEPENNNQKITRNDEAFAPEITQKNLNNEAYEARQISVTIPEQMALFVTEQGAVYSADAARIVNHTDAKIKVSSVQVEAAGDWILAPYGLEMVTGEPSGKFIGFSLNHCGTTAIGLSETLSLSGDWTIQAGSSLPLRYDAVMSLSSDLTGGEQVLTLVFVLDWA